MRSPALLLAGVLALGTTACDDEVRLTARPNNPPVAIALIDNGPDNAAEQRLAYVIQGQTARLDGSLSHDGEDTSDPTDLLWKWHFERQPADEDSADFLSDSDIVPDEDDADTEELYEAAFASFTPEALGTYRVSLIIEDADGADSTPAIVTVQVLPPSDLDVQLDWDDTRADLDVHLVGPDGTYFGDGDCFSWNPNPEWGQDGLATDNPALSGDSDGEGEGPYRENIHLETPAAGDYHVLVHYYSDHNEELGLGPQSANPTIDVTVFGESLLDDIASPSEPLLAGGVWDVGVLHWPAMTFDHINNNTTHTDLGGPPYNTESE